jgi:hypothetical protein
VEGTTGLKRGSDGTDATKPGLGAYGLRFYVIGPPLVTPDVPLLREYLLQLLPIVVVWGVAFRWFDLYRPRRLGSYLSEWGDVAKASTLG